MSNNQIQELMRTGEINGLDAEQIKQLKGELSNGSRTNTTKTKADNRDKD